MIQFKVWRQYTHIVDGVRFPPNMKDPYLLVYMAENSLLTDDYPHLNIRKQDVKTVVVPMTKIPRTLLTADLRKAYRGMGLFKTTIQRDLIKKGFKKTNISRGLRELRKEKVIGLYRRRWCLL